MQPSQNCTFCGLSGHFEANCRESGGSNKLVVRGDEFIKPIEGSVQGRSGNAVYYRLPLAIRRRKISVRRELLWGRPQHDQVNEDVIVDWEGDVLMCTCNDNEHDPGCLSTCASNLLQEPMLLSEDIKTMLLKGMRDNRSYGAHLETAFDEEDAM
ncbi:unnamed protein product [Discula destructiva]